MEIATNCLYNIESSNNVLNMTKQNIELEDLILNLLKTKAQISLANIAEEAGLIAKNEADRKAIQRSLANLIKKNLLKAKGNARARVYIANDYFDKSEKITVNFPLNHSPNEIFVSKESAALLTYLSKPANKRKPVSYNQDFLKSYIPNKTFYLSSSIRKDLEILGKSENVVHPAGTYARHILDRLLIDLSWNSSRLEGNTYSILETKRLIELGEAAENKDVLEAQMILNHKAAIEFIVDSAQEPEITSYEIRSIHALLSENLLGDPGGSGRLRDISVGISGTPYLPLNNPHVIKQFFEIFVEKLNGIKDSFEKSFFSLVHLSYLQAFEDVNKRTSRLVANIPLIKNNLKPLSFIDVNQKDYVNSLLGVYEKNDISLLQDLYLWAYRRSAQRYSAQQQAMGEPNLFKLKYRAEIQKIVRNIILENILQNNITSYIDSSIKSLGLTKDDSTRLFQIIETEIISLHDGNIARFKILPSEWIKWANKDKGDKG